VAQLPAITIAHETINCLNQGHLTFAHPAVSKTVVLVPSAAFSTCFILSCGLHARIVDVVISISNMRRITALATYSISALFLLSSIASTASYKVECVSTESEGYVTIKVWDTQKGKSYKAEQARKDAIQALLLSGLSGEMRWSS